MICHLIGIILLGMSSKGGQSAVRKTIKMISFFESIGSPRFISAPMVDQSSLPWRLFVKNHGADLAFTQMMHAKNFKTVEKYRSECIDWEDYSHISGSLDLTEKARNLDHPLIVQFAGDDPDTVVGAAKFVENQAAAVDLNLGCPQNIAKKGNYGAYLLPQRDRVIKVLSAMVDNLNCPVTAKIRVFDDEQETLELCKEIEATGVKMLTVHGRTVKSMKLFTGPVDWEIIRKIKETVNIPVIANGGISNRADALNCLEITGADGVMSSEALLENPKLFSEEGDYLFQHDFSRFQIQTAREFLFLVESYPLPKPLLQVIRGHYFKFLYRFVNAPKNYDVRDDLSKANFEDLSKIIDNIDDRFKKLNYDNQKAIELGFLTKNTWYMRHRTEKASSRVLCRPRASSNLLSLENSKSGNDENSEKLELKLKMEALKNRLKKSRAG